MDDNEWLNSYKTDKKDEYEFFSNDGKARRERWVISEFLKHLPIAFDENELYSPEQTNKADVIFRTARFQVKEICNPGIRRTTYVRGSFKDAQRANTIDDLKFPTIGEDIPPVARIYDLVVKEAKKKSQSKQYIDVKNELDLLFYVTRTHASLIKPDEIQEEDFSNLGWRSVCCLTASQALVLFYSQKSPDFLKK
jgi:hypothetical protein